MEGVAFPQFHSYSLFLSSNADATASISGSATIIEPTNTSPNTSTVTSTKMNNITNDTKAESTHWTRMLTMMVAPCHIAIRLALANLAPLTDCDEVYNYWEPVHFLHYGRFVLFIFKHSHKE